MFSIFKIILFYILQAYTGIIVLSIILSYIPRANDYAVCRGIKRMSEWYLEPLDGMLVLGSFDFSSMVGLMVLEGVISFCLL